LRVRDCSNERGQRSEARGCRWRQAGKVEAVKEDTGGFLAEKAMVKL